MSAPEHKLKQEIAQLETLRAQAKTALDNVLQLLEKTDQRRRTEVESRWDRISDNLERALDLTRGRLAKYEQLVKERERELRRLQETADLRGSGEAAADSGPPIPWEELIEAGIPREAVEADFRLPKDHVQVAERILAMPLDMLGNLTLDEVAEMNAQLNAEADEAAATTEPAPESETVPKSRLDERIERARQTREAREASSRRTEPSFLERRRQRVLREAIGKVLSGNVKTLDLDEIDLLDQCRKSLSERADKGESDRRIEKILQDASGAVQERASDLRRKRAQGYIRKNP